MKKYYKLIPLFLFYILIGCSEVDTSQQESISAGVIFQTARELKEEKGLKGLAYGGNKFPGIRRLEFALEANYSLEIDKARELLIYSTEKFLKNINASEELKPYLKKHPFKAKNVEVEIYLLGEKKSEYPHPPYLYRVIVDQGQISYYYKGHKETSYKDPLAHKESYKHAKEIASLQSNE